MHDFAWAWDVGGTFTDVIAVDGEGRVTFVKAAEHARRTSRSG